MKLFPIGLVVISLVQTAHADVADELARMLAKYPEADANRDGTLTEDEAGNYILRTFQRKRPNRGPGIRNRSLIGVYEARTYKSMPYRLLKPLRIEPGRRYPLIISLHGSGGIGDDNVSNLRFWNGVMARRQWREKNPCFVLVPQRRPGGIWGPKPDDDRVKDFYVRNDLLTVFELIAEIKQKFPIDDSRIYAIGSSGGGGGTWNILLAKPEMFAAAIPVCGRFPAQGDEVAKLTRIPIWCFHGDADPLVDVEFSRRAFAELTKGAGLMKYTELRGVKHNAWVQAFTYQGDDAQKGYVTRYSSDRCDRSQDLWQWIFRQRKP
jgi:predicted peptidase